MQDSSLQGQRYLDLSPSIELENMTSPEIADAIGRGMDTLVFGVGSIEQHGPCLPVLTDTAIADKLAFLVARELGNALKGPTIMMGCSDPHLSFAGTISLRKETLQNLVVDYCASMARHGFRRILIIPAHGGNFGPLKEIEGDLQKTHPDVQIMAYTDLHEFIAILQRASESFGISKEESGAHAGEFEVSQMLWAREDLVKKDKISESTGYMGEFTQKEVDVIWEEGIEGLSSIGVLGSAEKANPEHGKLYFEKLVSALIEFISKS
jgi:creatinine amidohydrolase